MIPGIVAGGITAPVGEVTLTDSTGTWICPDGVTSVCVVCVGEGGDGVQFGGDRSGGGGGALAYKNNVSVTPGGSYSYTIGTAGNGYSGIFGIQAHRGANGVSNSAAASGGTATGGDVNYSGGNGYRTSSATYAGGGDAGTYSGNGSNGSLGSDGTGIGLFGTGSTGTFGRGGRSVYSGSPTNGGAGRIRIIWGPGRSFPSNAA